MKTLFESFRPAPLLLFLGLMALAPGRAAALGSRFLDITTSGYLGGAPLTNFPLLVRLSTDITCFSYTLCRPDGADLAFLDAGSNLLAHEIDTWDTNGTSLVWVRVPELTTNTTIRLYFGDPDAIAPAFTTNGAVWADGYRAVLHMDDGTGNSNILDSTANRFGGVKKASNSPAETDAVVGKGQQFASNYINLTGLTDAATTHTVSMWIKGSSLAAGQYVFDVETGRFLVGWSTDTTAGKIGLYRTAWGLFGNTPSLNVWHHIAVCCSGTAAKLYVDGAFYGTQVGYSGVGFNGQVALGSRYSMASAYFAGLIDEVRVSSVLRSPDWLRAAYMNMASDSSFNAYGPVYSTNSSLQIVGHPSNYAVADPAYGLHEGLENGHIYTCSVSRVWTNATEDLRTICTGWKRYGIDRDTLEASPLGEADTNALIYTHTDIERLDWHFTRQYMIAFAAGAGGSVSTNGGWYTEGSNVTVTVTPSEGYEFVYWDGDIPASVTDVTVPSLTFASDTPRALNAVFRGTDAPPVNYTFVSGEWHAPATWTPYGIPGANDNVSIVSGECVANNSIRAGSVRVGSSGRLRLAALASGGTPASLLFEAGTLDIAAGGVVAIGGTTATAAGVKDQNHDSANLPSTIDVSVTHSLTNAGSLSIGGRNGTNTLSVAVGGDLIMAGVSTTAFYAGRATNALDLVGIYRQASPVAVGGDIRVLDTARLISENDIFSGNPIKFTSGGEFYVAKGARADADARGYGYFQIAAADYNTMPADMPWQLNPDGVGRCNLATDRFYTYGPGRAKSGYDVASGYGADGYNVATSNSTKQAYGFGKAYGWRLAPFLAGSPANLFWNVYNRGAGSVVVLADKVTVYGTISAYPSTTYGHARACGGGIMLAANDYEIDSKAVLRADGGYAGNYSNFASGGRLALLCNFNVADMSIITGGAEPEGVVVFDATQCCVPGLTARASYDYNGNQGALRYGPNKGTTCFAHPATTTRHVICVTGNYGDRGIDTATWGYGARTYAAGSSVTLSQTNNATFFVNGQIYSFTGYDIFAQTNRLTTLLSGPENTVTFPATDDYAVVWKWENTGYIMTANSNDKGSVLVEGETYSGGTPYIQVCTLGSTGFTPEIRAVPNSGYEFVCWDGAVADGQNTVNPIRLNIDAPRTISPIFRKTEPATTRTFNAGGAAMRGYWTDPRFWTPNDNIPGALDDVIIDVGECIVSNYLHVHSVTINTGAKLEVGGYGKKIGNAVNISPYTGELYPTAADAFLPIQNENLQDIDFFVDGDVTLNGSAQLGIGGIASPHQRWQDVRIGGNLTLNGTSVMLVSGGETNETYTYETGTAWVNIGGTFAINDTAKFVPQSEYYTGGSVKIKCGSLYIAAGASIDANRRGFSNTSFRSPTTLAPGKAYTSLGGYGRGAGYGGYGGQHSGAYGNPYGYEYAPIHPGSCGASYPSGIANEQGGGLIRIQAGMMEIHGRLLASAEGASYLYGGSSGGGIWLVCARVPKFVGTSVVLKARSAPGSYSGAAGGGGRIAITVTDDPSVVDTLTTEHTHPEIVRRAVGRDVFTNLFPNVTADVSVNRSQHVSPMATDGTFTYSNILPKQTLIMLR